MSHVPSFESSGIHLWKALVEIVASRAQLHSQDFRCSSSFWAEAEPSVNASDLVLAAGEQDLNSGWWEKEHISSNISALPGCWTFLSSYLTESSSDIRVLRWTS